MRTTLRTVFSRQRARTVAAGVLTAVVCIVVVQQSWSGVPVTIDTVVPFLIAGVALGSIYGVAAQGLVVTYATSGVFNFAQGAIGMFMAYVYWQLRVDIGLPTVVAFALTVAVLAPALGIFIERLIMRRLVTAPLVGQLVATVGLMLALMGLAASIWSPNVSRAIPRFFDTSGFSVGTIYVPWYRVIVIVTGVAIGIGLRLLLRHTRLGLSMRAVVDNRDLTVLNGARPDVASMTAWALGSSMAALAGIFLAQELSALDVGTLTLFIVDAFAAGIIARLKSLPMAYVGGLIIGLTIAFQQTFLNWGGRWTSAPNAIPAIILFLALLFVPDSRIAIRPKPRPGAERVASVKRALVGFIILFLLVAVAAGFFSRTSIRDVTLAMLTAFIMLSMVPLTGWANQISLGQIALAGCGAFALVQWGHGGNVLGLVIAAAFAVPVGILMAAPAVRLQGLYLALATMAFARMTEFLFFAQPSVYGSADRLVPRLELFGRPVSDPFHFLGVAVPEDGGFLIFVTVLFCLVGLFIVWLRRRAFARRVIAMRESPAAAVTIGVNRTMTKLVVFAFSAAIAGLAGGLFGIFYGSVGTQTFELTLGLPYLLLLVLGGVGLVAGAVFGGFALSAFGWLAAAIPIALLEWFQKIGPGMAGIGIGRNPEGAVVEMSNTFHRLTRRRRALEPVIRDERAVPASLPPLPPRRGAADTPVMELRDVSVRFGGLKAVSDVSIELGEGTVTGLIGPNGAGKTTLFNVATGLQEPESGHVIVDGEDVTSLRPHQLARRGLSRTFQRLEIFGALSARDNILVAAEMRRRWSRDRSIDPEAITDAVLQRVGLVSVESVRADQLPTGTARLVELGRALASQPRVLLLDEPSSGLNAEETGTIADLLRELAASGITIVVVEHDMGFIMDLCSKIVVLDAGRTIAKGTPAEIQVHPDVLAAYLGSTDVGAGKPEAPAAPAPVQAPVQVQVHEAIAAVGANGTDDSEAAAIELRGVSAGYGAINVLFDVDLVLKKSHVCAVLGPNGAGKSTLLKVASGQIRPNEGTVMVEGRSIDHVSTDKLVRNGLCVVPEGRGVFPNLTVVENLKMATYAGAPLDQVLDASFERFPILGQRQRQIAGTLSGGEQQMLAMSRALAVNPSVLLVDELSMGLAPVIVQELYEVVAQIAQEGVSLLIVEQFAYEVLRVADAAALLVHGHITSWGTPAEIDEVLRSAYLGGSPAQV